MKPPHFRRLLVSAPLFIAFTPLLLRAAAPLQEFGYRDLTVSVSRADGHLYGYAQGGASFLHFLVANDKPLGDKLTRAGFSKDETTAASLGLALSRDMTGVCAAYGLKVTADRVAEATVTARTLVK